MKTELSARQRQVLNLAAEGLTDKEIAVVTRLSQGTIRTYWDRMRDYYGARSRSAVVAKAVTVDPAFLNRYLIARLPLFVWTADPSGHVDYCNDWFSTVGGLSPGLAVGAGCRALMPDEELGESAERWQRAQEIERPYEALVHFFCGPTRELRPHKIQLVPLFGSNGALCKWFGYGRELADNADAQMIHFLQGLIA